MWSFIIIQVLGPYPEPTEQFLETNKLLKSSTSGYDAQTRQRTIRPDGAMKSLAENSERIVNNRAGADWEK